MSEYDDAMSGDMLGRVQKALDDKDREICKANGICPKCHGGGVSDCGGIDIACTGCGGSGLWADFEKEEEA